MIAMLRIGVPGWAALIDGRFGWESVSGWGGWVVNPTDQEGEMGSEEPIVGP
jgi:hypothetical protein